jgi:hypothetical protein
MILPATVRHLNELRGAGNQLIRSGGLALAESLLEDQANQLAAPGQAERRVTVKPHPGSFRVSCELW